LAYAWVVGLARVSASAFAICIYHDLRHSALSWLLEAGVEYGWYSGWQGHRIPGVTEGFLPLWEGRLREAVTVLERVTIEKTAEGHR
jgi:integrase